MKKGQLTIFVIIGLVLLVGIGLFFLAKPKSTEPSSLQAKEAQTAVTSYVQQCIAQVGEDSIRNLGTNGGYIDMVGLKDFSNQDRQVINLPAQKIPLWHEIQPCDESPTGCVRNHRPSLCAASDTGCPIANDGAPVNIQENIQKLVEKNIDSCLNNFTSMPDYIIEFTGRPTAKAVIREQNTQIQLSYPMRITTPDKQQVDLDQFSSTLDIQLPQIYRLARNIQLLERSNGFMEEVFLHLLSVYTGIDKQLPPFRDIQTSGAEHTWMRTNVQQTMEDGLMPFMNFMQIVNAKENYAMIYAPNTTNNTAAYANGIYRYLSVKLNDTEYPLAVTFEYPQSTLFLDINGKEYLRPRKMPDFGGMLSLFGIDLFDYRFKYSAAFPMVVHVTDPYAFSGRGFELDYGLEANIKNNIALNTSEPIVSVTVGSSTLDLAKPSQLVNHTYKIKIVDKHTNQALSNARVSYACGTQFYLGDTGGDGTWTGKLPYCLAGGYIVAEKQGYLRTGAQQDNTLDDQATTAASVALWPRKSRSINAYKLTAMDVANITAGCSPVTCRTKLGTNDSLIFMIQRIKDTPYDEDVPLVGVIQFGTASLNKNKLQTIDDIRAELETQRRLGTIPNVDLIEIMRTLNESEAQFNATTQGLTDTMDVDLVPGKYIVNGQLVYGGKNTIPADHKEECSGGLFGSCTPIDYPEKNMSNWISGGVQFDNSTPMVLEESDVYSDKNLSMYALEQTFIKTKSLVCKSDTCQKSVCSPSQVVADCYCAVQQCASANPNSCVKTMCASRNCTAVEQLRTCITTPATASATYSFPVVITYSRETPEVWDDMMHIKPIEEYQKYGRLTMAKPTFE